VYWPFGISPMEYGCPRSCYFLLMVWLAMFCVVVLSFLSGLSCKFLPFSFFFSCLRFIFCVIFFSLFLATMPLLSMMAPAPLRYMCFPRVSFPLPMLASPFHWFLTKFSPTSCLALGLLLFRYFGPPSSLGMALTLFLTVTFLPLFGEWRAFLPFLFGSLPYFF